MIQREPNDPAWYKGGLYHDNMPLDVPGLYFMSWYDVSVGPNLALYNHARKTSKVPDQHWAIIAPVAHCAFTRATADTIVGERSMGDARLNYQEIIDSFFDRFVKGVASPVLDALPKVTYYTMGLNKWQSSDVWPPRGARADDVLPRERGPRQHHERRWRARACRAVRRPPGRVHVRPHEPRPLVRRQRVLHGHRHHRRILRSAQDGNARGHPRLHLRAVPASGIELSGPITPTLYVSSDAKDTDFTVKVIDVDPDGRVYNLDESIQRMRYRDGYDKPLVWMQPDKVYAVTLQPLTTSNYFAPGHRLRIEVSSSNFPRFDRNLNTGGRNFDESKGVVAHNRVHHSTQYPSKVVVTVVRR